MVFLNADAAAPAAEPLFTPIMLVILIGLILILIILLAAYSVHKKKEEREGNAGFAGKGATFAGLSRRFYYAIAAIPVFRPALRRLERKLKPIYPSDDSGQIKEFLRPLVKIILISVVVSVLVFIFGFGLQPSVYTFAAACFISLASGNLIAMSIVKNEQNKFKDDFAQLVSRIGHYFYSGGNIVTAIEKASGRCGRLMKLHCVDFKKILTSEDVELSRRIYMEKDKDKYLKLFVSQAEIVKRTGPTKDENGKSVFLSSMTDLINSIQEDKRRNTEKQYGFLFFGWVASIPCILQPYIAEWGMYTIGALASFYVGRSGNIWKIVMLVVSFLAYKIISILQDDSGEIPANPYLAGLVKLRPVMRFIDVFHDPDSQKVYKIKTIMRRSGDNNNYRVYYLKRVLAAVASVVLVFILCVAGHAENKKFLVTETVTLEDACNNADSKQKEVIYQLEPEYMERLTKSGERPTYEELVAMISKEPGLRTMEAVEDMANVIVDKLETYDREAFDFLDIFIIIIAAVIAFFCPTLIMFVRKVVIKDRVADEIVQLQTVVNMMRKLPGILPINILLTMEEFSTVYKKSLRECISKYPTDPEAALQDLYFSEKETDFRMIIEDFLRVPQTGVENAFAEVTSQIENYAENRKMEQKQSIEKMTKAAMWISMVPALVIIFGYMLTPFMMGVLKLFDNLSGSLGGF